MLQAGGCYVNFDCEDFFTITQAGAVTSCTQPNIFLLASKKRLTVSMIVSVEACQHDRAEEEVVFIFVFTRSSVQMDAVHEGVLELQFLRWSYFNLY